MTKKRSPLQAIRAFCMECQGDLSNAHYVRECKDTACPFYAYRLGTPPEGEQHQPMKAIKQYCFENCQAGAGREEVLSCQGDKAVLGPCPVFNFRLGRNPNISEATREKARERELRKLAEGTNSLPTPPAHAPFHAPGSTETGRGIL